jgi:hypothetical protein
MNALALGLSASSLAIFVCKHEGDKLARSILDLTESSFASFDFGLEFLKTSFSISTSQGWCYLYC